MDRVKLTLTGSCDVIPEDYEEFVEWAKSWGFHVYSEGNFSQSISQSGDIFINVNDRYLIHLDHGGYIVLTKDEAEECGLEEIE